MARGNSLSLSLPYYLNVTFGTQRFLVSFSLPLLKTATADVWKQVCILISKSSYQSDLQSEVFGFSKSPFHVYVPSGNMKPLALKLSGAQCWLSRLISAQKIISSKALPKLGFLKVIRRRP